MTRPKFITKFLIPSLDDERFGHRLEWVDRKLGVFQLQWNHKAEHAWTEFDAQVFTAWDKMKGHYEPSTKDYFSRSKQRFRALLYKFTNEQQLRKMESTDKKFHRFCIVQMSGKRMRSSTDENEVMSLKKEEFMDFENLCYSELNHIGGSEQENFQMNFLALLKDHRYSTEVPQLEEEVDPFLSDVKWELSEASPDPPSVYEALARGPFHCSDECCFNCDHPKHGDFANSLHVELTILPDKDAEPLL